MTLHEFADADTALTRCGCGAVMRPEGTTAAQYPGTLPHWGNGQCRVCDYTAAGRDPEDRFLTRERAGYLEEIRTEIECGRRSRGIPAEGSLEGRTPISELLAGLTAAGGTK